MASADLYLNRINFLRYLNQTECAQCGFPSCETFIEELRKGTKKPRDCSLINRNKAYAFETIQRIEELWPEVPLLTHPRPSFVGLVELNTPDSESLVLVSGNNEYTEMVLMTVLGTTKCPFFIIFSNTEGNTIDMAMIYHAMTAESVYIALKETRIEEKVNSKEMIIPGLAASLKEDIEKLSGWHVSVGPVCAAELPLFLSELWIPP